MTEETMQMTVPQLMSLMKELGVADRATVQRMAALSKAVNIGRLTSEEWSLLARELENERLTHMGLAIFGKAFSKAHLNYDEKSALTVLFASSGEFAA